MTSIAKIVTLAGFMLVTLNLSAQQETADAPQPPPLDSVQLKTLRGAISSFSVLSKKEPIVLLCFWSVNSEPSIGELNAINAQYAKWNQAVPFKMMGICLDQGNLLNRMKGTANMNGWTIDVYGDINGDLQKIFNVNDSNLPVSMVLNKGKVVYRQSGFGAGTENYLFTKIQGLSR